MNRQPFCHACIVLLLLCALSSLGQAGELRAELSSTQAYVGAPVILQVALINVTKYEAPVIPEIDGLKIEPSDGARRSSQTTIINGRMIVVFQYKVTPLREGDFEIPPLIVSLDGRKELTQRFLLTATKSETGDLLFVEIAGKKDHVYVGEPLDLALQIWIKPYQDSEYDIELNEAVMWGRVSSDTNWGIFADRMQELDDNRQRPGGREVQRLDSEGNEQRYYVYTIHKTIYPSRPGQIDAGDVNVIVDYPTALRGQPDFANPARQRMLDDDFFGLRFDGFRFSTTLSIAATRPIVAGAEVQPTEIVPVPEEGRPEDYRGTVGKYEIITQIDTANVQAGDPIQLDIRILGDGPMDRVQAPPLSDIKALTDNFKVSDQPLAGIAQGNTKLFSTAIRPLREGITEVPPIPLSYFDPQTGKFATEMSEPIPITVTKSDTLALDSIATATPSSKHATAASPSVQPARLFENDESESVLVSQTPPSRNLWWLPIVIAPPCLWLLCLVVVHGRRVARLVPRFRSAGRQCEIEIDSATTGSELVAALVRFVGGRFAGNQTTSEHAVGQLRLEGLYPQAAELESFIDRVRRDSERDHSQDSMATWRKQATGLMREITAERSLRSKTVVGSQAKSRSVSEAGRSALLVLLCTSMCAGIATGAESALRLDPAQQRSLLDEASRDYSAAIQTLSSDAGDAKELFRSAASKYQSLVDSGIHNSRLYANLGNAYLQSGEVGRAIANYERAQGLDPISRQLDEQLRAARGLVDKQANQSTGASGMMEWSSVKSVVRIAYTPILWTLLLSSCVFWGLAIVRTAGVRFAFWRVAAFPLIALLITATLMTVFWGTPRSKPRGIVVAEKLTLRAGDSDTFHQVATINHAEGQPVEVLVSRGNWARIQTEQGDIGWIPNDSLEIVSTQSPK